MIRQTLFILCLFAGLTSSAQTSIIEIGHIEKLHSSILQEDRAIWIHTPRELNTNFAAERYPVVYLLDGDMNFPAVEAILQQFGDGTVLPKMILVGVANTNRLRDLTPSKPAGAPGIAGGGEKFLSFMERELIPHIDSLYPTAPYRILIGHSLGGLMAVHTMFNHSELFNAFVAIDPSLFWDDQKLLKQARTETYKPLKPTVLYIAIANTLEKGMDTTKVQRDTSGNLNNLHIGTILKFAHQFDTHRPNLLRSNWKYYPEYNHVLVPPVAAFDGLRYIFNYYNLGYSHDAFEDSVNHPADTLISSHYKMISKQMGYTVNPPELFVNDIGRTLAVSRQFERAYYYFTMNVKNYPGSFNANYALADFFDMQKNKQKAIEYYQKALAVKDSQPVREKLENLKKGL